MFKIKPMFLAYLACLIFLECFSQGAQAFSCSSNGVNIGGAGTFLVPIDVTLSKSANEIILTDMSAYTSCLGQQGYSDALRTTNVSISSALVALGYQGFMTSYGSKYSFPVGQICVWPDAGCATNYPNLISSPVEVAIGMQRSSAVSGTGISLPAGTEVARFQVQQRSMSTWGWDKTWIFTLKNPLVIPAYTCAWNNPNQTVTLPAVTKKDLIANGTGRYPQPTPFELNMTCDKETTVSVQFDGTTMTGKNDVLANDAGENEDVGIQLVYNSASVKFAEKVKVIENAEIQETLSYQAYYYYNGGTNIQGGNVNATTTVTFTYQ